METKLRVLKKVVSIIEEMSEDVFREWDQNGGKKDYLKLKEFMENNLPMPKLGDPGDVPNPEDEFPIGC